MPQPQLKLPKKSAQASVVGVAIATIATLTMLVGGGNAGAVPVARTPAPSVSPGATATPSDVLPYNGSLLFVLDGTLSSASSKKGDEIRVHLRDPLILNGKTLAPAGTPGRIRVVNVQGAKSGDVYGYVEIFFEPITLADGKVLPLRAPANRLTVNVSAGHEATVGIEDTVTDIFIPYAPLWQAFRKGKNFTLQPGAEIRARSLAEVRVTPEGAVAVSTPLPIILPASTPHPSFSALPMVTPAGWKPHTPKPSATPSASPGPTSTP